MKALVLVAALVAASAPAFALTVSTADASRYVGQPVTVEGTASVYASAGGTIFVDLGGSGRESPFTGVIFKDYASKFPNVTSYSGKTVDITGLVQLYQGKPEIVLRSLGQLSAK
jgi:DNA/RNA endonuclease YhcR with UshA esterase domain